MVITKVYYLNTPAVYSFGTLHTTAVQPLYEICSFMVIKFHELCFHGILHGRVSSAQTMICFSYFSLLSAPNPANHALSNTPEKRWIETRGSQRRGRTLIDSDKGGIRGIRERDYPRSQISLSHARVWWNLIPYMATSWQSINFL